MKSHRNKKQKQKILFFAAGGDAGGPARTPIKAHLNSRDYKLQSNHCVKCALIPLLLKDLWTPAPYVRRAVPPP